MSEVGMSYNAGFSPGGAELQRGGLPPPPPPEAPPVADAQSAPTPSTDLNDLKPTQSGPEDPAAPEMADTTDLAMGIGADTGGKEINAQRMEKGKERLAGPAEGQDLSGDDAAMKGVGAGGSALTTAGSITMMASPATGPGLPIAFIVGAIITAIGAILSGISAIFGGKGGQRMAQLKQGAQTRDAGEKAVAEAAKSDRAKEITILADANAQTLQGSQDTQGTQVETSSAAQMTMESSAAA